MDQSSPDPRVFFCLKKRNGSMANPATVGSCMRETVKRIGLIFFCTLGVHFYHIILIQNNMYDEIILLHIMQIIKVVLSSFPFRFNAVILF